MGAIVLHPPDTNLNGVQRLHNENLLEPTPIARIPTLCLPRTFYLVIGYR